MLEDSQGNFWVGTENDGLNILDPITGVAKRYRHQDGDPNSLIDDDISYNDFCPFSGKGQRRGSANPGAAASD